MRLSEWTEEKKAVTQVLFCVKKIACLSLQKDQFVIENIL